MTLTVTLPPELADRVRASVATGRYPSLEAAVLGAVAADSGEREANIRVDGAGGPPSLSFDDSTPEGREKLAKLLDEGEASLAAGRYVTFDAEGLDRFFDSVMSERRARKAARQREG